MRGFTVGMLKKELRAKYLSRVKLMVVESSSGDVYDIVSIGVPGQVMIPLGSMPVLHIRKVGSTRDKAEIVASIRGGKPNHSYRKK